MNEQELNKKLAKWAGFLPLPERDDSWEDPTTSSGGCKSCGSSHWSLTTLDGEKVG